MTDAQRHLGLTHLILDSGAYSAYTKGVSIYLEAYCDLLDRYPMFETYVNLDVINPNDPEEAAQASMANFTYMLSRGKRPIPIVHAGEDIEKWLGRHLDLGCDYIGLGSSRPPEETLRLDEKCFEFIERSGQNMRVHAFGESKRRRLKGFPFASADSVSWIKESQVYQRTNIDHLVEETSEENEKLTARVYRAAYHYSRLDKAINEDERRRGFAFYMGFKIRNSWAFPVFHLLRYRKALVSFYGLAQRNADLLRQFIQNPEEVLAMPRYAEKLALLPSAQERFRNRR